MDLVRFKYIPLKYTDEIALRDRFFNEKENLSSPALLKCCSSSKKHTYRERERKKEGVGMMYNE